MGIITSGKGPSAMRYLFRRTRNALVLGLALFVIGVGEAREPQSIAEMVAAGLGVSVMPTLNLPDTYDGIATRPLDPRTPRTLAVALSSDASPVARAFAAELAERQSAACQRGATTGCA